MKLTDELKDKVDEVDTMEEEKNIIAEAGMELTDDELEMASGGARDDEMGVMKCSVCGWKFPYFKNIKDDYVHATEMFQRHVRYNCIRFPFGPR